MRKIDKVIHSTMLDNPTWSFVKNWDEIKHNGKDGMITLHIDTKNGVNSNLTSQIQIKGEEVFDAIHSKLIEVEGLNSIKGIRAQWVYGDNLETFNKLILEEVKLGKISLEEAALKTFTGKMAVKKRKIFYEMKSVGNVPPGHFKEQFMKDLSNPDITDLSQIRWRFNGEKAPDNFRENMMKAIDQLPLTDDLAKKLIKDVPDGIEINANLLQQVLKEDFDNLFKLIP